MNVTVKMSELEKHNDALCSRNDLFYDDNTTINKILLKPGNKFFMHNPGVGEERRVEVETCHINTFVCKIGKHRDSKSLRLFLDETDIIGLGGEKRCLPSLRIFFIPKESSRSPLSISAEGFEVLRSRIQIPKTFLNILSNFGAEPGPYADGCSNYYSKTTEKDIGNRVLETSYVLKYVEAHNRIGTIVPWSIRQTAFYQRYEEAARTSDCIFLQPSEDIERRIGELVENWNVTQLPKCWTSIQKLILGTITGNWTSYIKLLDKLIDDIGLSIKFTRLGSSDPSQLTFSDLKKLNQFTDLVVRITHALELNIEVLANLSESTQKRASGNVSDEIDGFLAMIEECRTEHIFIRHHAGLVKENADRLGVQLRDTIALQDSNTMLTLTQKTIQEAQTVKTITFVALVYLPATFTATFLGMDYTHVKSKSGHMELDVSRDMWFYLAITLPLMLVTVLVWWAWDFWMRRTVSLRLAQVNNTV